MTSAVEKLESILQGFERVRRHPVATQAQLATAEQSLGRAIPTAYREFLAGVSNGAELDGFTLLPVFDAAGSRTDAKRTWNGVQRNNTPDSAPWFDRDAATFAHFFVFASAGAACFALPYHGDEDVVWLWESGATKWSNWTIPSRSGWPSPRVTAEGAPEPASAPRLPLVGPIQALMAARGGGVRVPDGAGLGSGARRPPGSRVIR
jgi:hypothetical protein